MEYNSNQSYADKRSTGMAIAALVMGICGAVTGLCPYTGFILGSIAIILGLLSRGGEMTMSGQAKAGVVLGAVGIALSTIMIFLFIGFGFSGYSNYRTRTHTDYYEDFYDDFYDDFHDDYHIEEHDWDDTF